MYWKIIDEGTYVQVMPGRPHSDNPAQRLPYVNYRVSGRSVDKYGRFIANDAPEAHIPLDEFVYLDCVLK